MKYDVIIIGAGFAGLYLLHKLRADGYQVLVIDKNDDIGGTWYQNRYPGLRCDVESLDYSFSFNNEIEEDWVWSEKYATQPEILRYINYVADRLKLRSNIRLNGTVSGAFYLKEDAMWKVEVQGIEQLMCKYLVMATGCLSLPKHPDIKGIDKFGGKSLHTANWPKSSVDFRNLKVAVIGTGSSAIQSIPIIASQASKLCVYQRTPAFSLPALNQSYGVAEFSSMAKNYSKRRELSSNSIYGTPHLQTQRSVRKTDEVERKEIFERAWNSGVLSELMLAFNDILIDPESNKRVVEFIHGKIKSIVKNLAVAETLCPKDFPFGTKRACLDTAYYETFNLSHVELIDLKRTPLLEITERGILTSEGERGFDCIVYATGYDAVTGALLNINIVGSNGRSLCEKWAAGPQTYLGLAVNGFPNLFTITGPGSPSVMSNMILSIEHHVQWITSCLDYLRAKNFREIEATLDAEQAWGEHVNDLAEMTLFPRADSWYMGANVPGKPRVFMAYLGGVGRYNKRIWDIATQNYAGFHIK